MDITIKAAMGVAILGIHKLVAYASVDFNKSKFAFWVISHTLVKKLFDELFLRPEFGSLMDGGSGAGCEVMCASAEVPYGLRCLAVFGPGMGFSAEGGGSGIAIFSWDRCGGTLVWCTVIGLEFFCIGVPLEHVIGITFFFKPCKLA